MSLYMCIYLTMQPQLRAVPKWVAGYIYMSDIYNIHRSDIHMSLYMCIYLITQPQLRAVPKWVAGW